jgi:hypothetical protein
MQSIIDVLKSRGKLGGAGLMILGLGHMVGVYLGKLTGDYTTGATIFFTGLGILGIRGKQG